MINWRTGSAFLQLAWSSLFPSSSGNNRVCTFMKKLFLPPKSTWKNELTALIKQNVSGFFAGEGAYSLFLDSGYREVSPVRIDFGLHGIKRFVGATAFVFKSSVCSFHDHFAACFVKMSHNKIAARRRLLKSGRADRIRTCDLFVPNEENSVFGY